MTHLNAIIVSIQNPKQQSIPIPVYKKNLQFSALRVRIWHIVRRVRSDMLDACNFLSPKEGNQRGDRIYG